MTAAIRRAGDRLLGKLLTQEVAGACVPEHGQPCDCYCEWIDGGWSCVHTVVDCYGSCNTYYYSSSC